MRPGHVEQGATPTLTLGTVSDEIYRLSCDRRQHRLCYQTPPPDGWHTATSQENKRQMKSRSARIDMYEETGGKDLAVVSRPQGEQKIQVPRYAHIHPCMCPPVDAYLVHIVLLR